MVPFTSELADLPPGDLRALRAQIARELAAEDLRLTRQNAEAIRERCQTFAGFVREAWHILEPANPLKWSWHLDAMCMHLEAISRGEMTPWLIMNVPPGSSKSMIVSVMWQAWEWGPFGKPTSRFLTSSFEMENVTRDTRKTRDLIQSDWYRELWPEVFNENGKLTRSGETSFANRHHGTREGVPFTSIMGKRGDKVIIDDPHSLKGAESEAERTETVRLFLEGGLNRFNDQMTSAMVIVMQRVHQDDLSGALLARNLGFVHLMIPMEFEEERRCTTPIDWTDPRSYEGELMDPVRMPKVATDKLKSIGEYSWNGQYQQRPAPREGGLFKVDKITTITASPGGGKAVRGWDLAGTKRKKSAYTVGLKLRRIPGLIIIEDVKRLKGTPREVKIAVRDCAIEDGLLVKQSLPKDPGQAGVAQKDDYADWLAGHNFHFTPETGDKETRALGVASAIEADQVVMVKADWNAAFKEELRGFPTATYKDQVDALSRAYSELVGVKQQATAAGPEIVDETSAPATPETAMADDPW